MSDYESIHGKRVNFLSSDPTLTSSYEGQVWYNSTVNRALVQIKAFSSGGSTPTNFVFAGGVGGHTDTLGFGGVGPSPQPAHNLTIEYSGFTWRAQPNLNTSRRAGYAFGTSTSAVYAGGDYAPGSPTITLQTEEYNGSSWTTGNNISEQGSFGAASGTLTAGLAYGGYNAAQTAASTRTVSYDGTDWTAMPTPGADTNVSGNFTMGGGGTQTAAIFSGGSPYSGTRGTSTETFDGSSWTSQNNMNTGRGGQGLLGTQTNALYAGGRGPSPSRTGATEEWDSSTWTTSSATMSSARNASITSKGGSTTTAVIGAGSTGSNTNATEEYSSSLNVETTGSWVSGGSLNSNRSTLTFVGTSSTSMLAVGGYIGNAPSPPTFQTQNSVESYNGSSWTAVTALPIYVASGFGAGTTTAGLHAGGSENQSPPHQSTNKSQEYNGSSWTAGGTMTQTQQLGASAGTQTAGLLWGGKTGHPPSNTNVAQEYNGSSWTAGGSHPVSSITRTMGSGTQTAAINFGGHNDPPADYATTFFYNGSSWTAGPNMALARNGAMGSGTQTLAICGGGYMYSPPPGGTAATEWFDGSSWTNIANNNVSGPSTFSGPGGAAATDCLALVNGQAYEWTGQPTSTTTASTLTTS